MFNSLINWFKEKSRVVHVQGDPSIDPDEEFHGEGDTSMATPATQEDTDDWGNPKPDNLAKGCSAPKSSGADDVFGEPKSGDAAKALPGTDPFVGGW